MAFPTRLRRELIKKYGTISDAARELDIPYNTIWWWLNKKKKPLRHEAHIHFMKMRDVLGVTYKELLE